MPKFSRGKQLKNWKSSAPDAKPGKLRIIGGKYRGRQIDYLGEKRTRPMKDNVREALFNLVGGWVPGKCAIDLFAGTGAVGLEAISRGASQAILIERHIPTAKVIHSNIKLLDEQMPAVVESGDTFYWGRQFLRDDFDRPSEPWVVFCCAPYDLFVDKCDEVVGLLAGLMEKAPQESLIVVESDSRFDLQALPSPETWKSRQYSPAVVSVCKIGFPELDTDQVHE